MKKYLVISFALLCNVVFGAIDFNNAPKPEKYGSKDAFVQAYVGYCYDNRSFIHKDTPRSNFERQYAVQAERLWGCHVEKGTRDADASQKVKASQQSLQSATLPEKAQGGGMFRSPAAIANATRGGSGEGDAETEAAVMKVLWWLKANQKPDGSWSGGNTLANTGFALLTFLAHGEFPGSASANEKYFGSTVQLAMDYIVSRIDDSGSVVRMLGADGNEYAFLIATYALCEAYGMTLNPNYRDSVCKCLERIIKGQSLTGGWDYKINSRSVRDDMSFAGWALQALKAGKMAGLQLEGLDECIKKAINCMQARNFKDGGFNYTAGGNPTGLTATGCFAMQQFGYGNEPEVRSALDFMREWNPAFDKAGLTGKSVGSCPQYYCYYATQCKYLAANVPFAAGKDVQTWEKWNSAMKQAYPSSIREANSVVDLDGVAHDSGYFSNLDAHSSRPVMDTCLVALQLMVYYRYVPFELGGQSYDSARIAGMTFADQVRKFK